MMEYRNPKFNHLGTIDCDINHPFYGWIPFTCDPKDKGATALDPAELYAEIIAAGGIAPYVPDLEALANEARFYRDHLLMTQVDPIAGNALRWAGLTPEQQTALGDYRQALLDITKQAGFPEQVIWPEKPDLSQP